MEYNLKTELDEITSLQEISSMANQEHLDILKQGVETWNQWRQEHPEIRPDLNETDLSGTNLSNANLEEANLNKAVLSNANLREANLNQVNLNGANLSGADCRGTAFIHANLSGSNLSSSNFGAQIDEYTSITTNLFSANLNSANLRHANLSGAILVQASLHHADLSHANLREADLRRANLIEAKLNETLLMEANLSEALCNSAVLKGADLREVNLTKADLSDADLGGVDLRGAFLTRANLFSTDLSGADFSNTSLMAASLISTDLTQTDLTNCRVYGISPWDVRLKGAKQLDLVITLPGQATITVDNLKLAQFIYLLLDNEEIRDVIDTITTKVVLILGRFSEERKLVLDALRRKLRTLNFLPIVFDFERSTERDFTETIMTLAGLSCFIVADITNPKSSPLEMQATVPNYMIPFVPIIQEGERPFSMFQDLTGKYDWVLDTLVYDTPSNLIKGLERAIVTPALEKRDELLAKKVEQLRTRHIENYL